MIKFRFPLIEIFRNRGTIETAKPMPKFRDLKTIRSFGNKLNTAILARAISGHYSSLQFHRLRIVRPVLINRILPLLAAMASIFCVMVTPAQPRELTGNVTENLTEELGFPLYVNGPELASPKAVIVAIHGATLHGRAFDTFSKAVAKRGYLVIAGDMRGFGDWIHGKPRGEYPRHVLYKWSESDLRHLLAKLRELYPEKPIYLVGESVGANMAVRLLAGDPYCAEGAILSSPAVKQRVFINSTLVKQFFTVMVKPKTQLSVEPFIQKRISENPLITQERLNDPLGRNQMNVGELFKTRWFNKESIERAPLYPRKAPILVMEGAEDQLFCPEDVHKLMSDLPSVDKELLWLKGKGHINLETKYLDPGVVDIVVEWLDKKTATTAAMTSAQSTVSPGPTGETHPATSQLPDRTNEDSHLQAKATTTSTAE